MLIDECIFNDKDVFKTSLYDDDVKLIFLSTLIEPHLGIYRRKGTDIEIAFGEWCYPLTDEENWSALLKGEVNNFQNNYTKQWLKEFSEKYEFVGRLTEEQIINNIKLLLRRVSNEVHICLLLGSETPYLKNHQKAYEGRESIHSRINKQVKDLAKNEPRLHYLDMNDYIVDQASFIDNINHYQRQIYYSASKIANKIIAEVCGQKIEEKGRIALIIEIIAGIINRNLQPSNPLFKPLQWIYHKITINRRL